MQRRCVAGEIVCPVVISVVVVVDKINKSSRVGYGSCVERLWSVPIYVVIIIIIIAII